MAKLKRPIGKYDRLLSLIYGRIGVLGLSLHSLSDKTQIPYSRLYRRFKSPEEMTLEELSAIKTALGIPSDDLRGAIQF